MNPRVLRSAGRIGASELRDDLDRSTNIAGGGVGDDLEDRSLRTTRRGIGACLNGERSQVEA